MVHLGFPKTGTTTTQNVFYAQRKEILACERVLYPSLNPNLSNVLCTNFRDDPLQPVSNRLAGLTREEARERGRQELVELEEEIVSTQWDTLLLSAEGLSHLGVVELPRLQRWASQFSGNIEVLACVRQPFDYAASFIQQILKWGSTLADLYDRPPVPNYQAKLSRVIDVFGRDNVRVFCFESAVNTTGGIVAEFARQVGLSEALALRLSERSTRVNDSLTDVGVAVLDAMNQIRPMFVDGRRNPKRSGREVTFISRLGGGRYSLPIEVEDRIRATCVEDVRWLNATFDLDLYPEASRGAPAPDEGSITRALDPEVAISIAAVIGDLVNRPRQTRRPGPRRGG